MTEAHHLAEEFKVFREECTKLAILLNTFDRIFTEENEETLKKSSHHFFDDLNVWMIELFITKCLRILDNPEFGKRDNLSVFFFERELGSENAEIKRLAQELSEYRDLLKKARNRIIAHADREDLISKTKHGSHEFAQHQKFRSNLQEFCDKVGRLVGVGPSEFINIVPMSVFPLVRTLKAGLEALEN